MTNKIEWDPNPELRSITDHPSRHPRNIPPEEMPPFLKQFLIYVGIPVVIACLIGIPMLNQYHKKQEIRNALAIEEGNKNMQNRREALHERGKSMRKPFDETREAIGDGNLQNIEGVIVLCERDGDDRYIKVWFDGTKRGVTLYLKGGSDSVKIIDGQLYQGLLQVLQGIEKGRMSQSSSLGLNEGYGEELLCVFKG